MKPILALLLFFLVGCHKENVEHQLEGNYSGVFQRTSPVGFFPPRPVTLNLKGNSFSGTADNARNPAICHGSWKVEGTEIHFANACVWTADFDWTLILDKEFEYTLRGDSLLLTRDQGGSMRDTYFLVRKPQ